MNHKIDYLSGNLNIEKFGNQYIAFSDVTASHIFNVFPNFSIKYVYEGSLCYKIDSRKYEMARNNILYATSQPGEVYFDNPRYQRAVGLCIGLNEELFLEALRIHSTECLAADPEESLNNFSNFPQFLEGLYQKNSKKVNHLLYNTCCLVEQGYELRALVTDEWFLQLAEEIVKEEISNFRFYNNLKVTKPSTKKESLRRLFLAKKFMDESFLTSLLISEIAKIALMSEYHFFRSFKMAFGVSPYQYLLNKRLDFAKDLIQIHKVPIIAAASMVGFSDQFAFSKAFKARFKVGPKYFKPNCPYSSAPNSAS